VAQGISRATGLVFAEADQFHSDANVAKMRAGQPLDDADRAPWLEALAAWMTAEDARGRSTVIACSALRRAYRDVLRAGPPTLDFAHLDGPAEVVRQRMATREGHYMPASLLDSQLRTLEPLEPDESGVVLDLTHSPDELVAEAVSALHL
jgi:gluconokinase